MSGQNSIGDRRRRDRPFRLRRYSRIVTCNFVSTVELCFSGNRLWSPGRLGVSSSVAIVAGGNGQGYLTLLTLISGE